MSLSKHFDDTLKLVSNSGASRLLLMGAGQFAAKLSSCLVDNHGVSLVGFVDDNSAKWGKHLGSLPVFEPKPELAAKADAVLIASDSVEDMLQKRAESLFPGLPVFRMERSRCPICLSSDDLSNERFPGREILLCRNCGHAFVDDMPAETNLSARYDNIEYWKQDRVRQGIHDMTDGPEWDVFKKARFNFLYKSGVLPKEPPKGFSCFEVGCAEGIILYTLKKMGCKALGCELNPQIIAASKKALDVDIMLGSIYDISLPPNSFDAIFSFHVFEHLLDPRGAFEICSKLLKPGGKMLLELPTGPEEYGNVDHFQFFAPSSAAWMMSHTLIDVGYIRNHYRISPTIEASSVLGYGTKPK